MQSCWTWHGSCEYSGTKVAAYLLDEFKVRLTLLAAQSKGSTQVSLRPRTIEAGRGCSVRPLARRIAGTISCIYEMSNDL